MSVAPVTAAPRPSDPSQNTVDLSRLVADIAARPEWWEPAVDLAGHGAEQAARTERHWARIDGPPGVDVWVLSWLTFQGTDLHDHGRSAAAFTVVRGALHEIRPDDQGRLKPRKFTPGLVATIEPGAVHDVRNELAGVAVSIHAYAPRLTEMTYYEWVSGRITPVRTVRGNEPEQQW
jgi:hypothetical protein